MREDLLKLAYLDHELEGIAEQIFINRKKNEIQIWAHKNYTDLISIYLEELGIKPVHKEGRGSVFFKIPVEQVPKPGLLWRLRHLVF